MPRTVKIKQIIHVINDLKANYSEKPLSLSRIFVYEQQYVYQHETILRVTNLRAS